MALSLQQLQQMAEAPYDRCLDIEQPHRLLILKGILKYQRKFPKPGTTAESNGL